MADFIMTVIINSKHFIPLTLNSIILKALYTTGQKFWDT